jgi:hypothetical protein
MLLISTLLSTPTSCRVSWWDNHVVTGVVPHMVSLDLMSLSFYSLTSTLFPWENRKTTIIGFIMSVHSLTGAAFTSLWLSFPSWRSCLLVLCGSMTSASCVEWSQITLTLTTNSHPLLFWGGRCHFVVADRFIQLTYCCERSYLCERWHFVVTKNPLHVRLHLQMLVNLGILLSVSLLLCRTST